MDDLLHKPQYMREISLAEESLIFRMRTNHNNVIDAIAGTRGWHPLKVGEQMTVHYMTNGENRSYTIIRNQNG